MIALTEKSLTTVMDISKELCEQYLEEKFDEITWSFSRINSFYTCPLTWYDTYVLGNYSTNYLAEVGSLVHNILEDYYKYHLAGGTRLLNEEIREVLVKKFVKGLKKVKSFDKPPWHRGHENNIIKGLNTFVHDPEIIAVEREYLFEINGYKFKGFIDFEEEYFTGDYKSKWSFEKYAHQQSLYVTAREYNGVYTKGFKVVEYKKNMAEPVTYTDTVVIQDDAHLWAVKGVEDIRKALQTASFPATPDSFFCYSLCGVRGCENHPATKYSF